MFRNRLAGLPTILHSRSTARRAMRGFYAPRRQHRTLLRCLGLLLVWSLLANPLQILLPAGETVSASLPVRSATGVSMPAVTITTTPAATSITTPQATGTTPLATGTGIPSATGTTTPFASGTTTPPATGTATPTPPPPPSGTVGLPTPGPTVTLPPDTDYLDQAIATERTALLQQLNSLPLLTGTLTGTLVTGSSGGRINSADGTLSLGLLPGFVPTDQTINIQVAHPTFAPSDPRATRNGEPLAYMYALTATTVLTGGRITSFQKEVDLVWRVDTAALAAAGVRGWPLHVYTFDEQQVAWVEILSRWDPATGQLIVTTPHFSFYAVGSGFDMVNNYLPTINNFETDLQSGTAASQYPINRRRVRPDSGRRSASAIIRGRWIG